MAEIRIEKKKPVWPWVIVVIIILLIIYFFWYRDDQNFQGTDELLIQDTISQVEEPYQNDTQLGDTETLYTGTYGTVKKEEALADYFRYVDKLENKSHDQGFYRMAFFKLITATKRQSEIEGVDVSSNISAAMNDAENLTNDPTTTEKADSAKKAADEISKALKTIQEKNHDNLSDKWKEVQSAASGIDGSQTLDKQSDNIDVFFDRTASLLQNMNDNEDNR